MVVEALGRGINVLCEKPLCIKREDIDRILEAERQSGAMLGVCLQNRYNASNLFVKEYLEGKKIDNASGIVFWHRDAAYYASGEWRGKWETEGGGVLINQALHTLDLLIWICGEPSEITASTSTLTLAEHIEVEDTATLVCHGENPFIFSATNCSARDCPVELTLFADGECIKVLSRDVLVGGELHHFEDAYKPLGKVCYGSGHEALITDFYDCIASGRRFAIDGSEGAKVVKVILGAYESQGKKIEIK
jgi:predicted dehydrogenase